MADYLIIRHAQPELRGTLLGQSDPPLSEAGRYAAAALQVHAETFISSPLRRARETAQYVSESVTIVQEFREWSYGEWDGLSWNEIEARFPVDAKRRSEDWFGFSSVGQESWTDFVARVDAGWQSIQSLPKPIAIFAHEAVNSVLWRKITGADPMKFRQTYCEILEA